MRVVGQDLMRQGLLTDPLISGVHGGRMFAPSRVLAVILGGGRGQRLYPLTRDRSKPAVPLAGKYRLIDIPISNCINSGSIASSC